jgi:hypothetical protein
MYESKNIIDIMIPKPIRIYFKNIRSNRQINNNMLVFLSIKNIKVFDHYEFQEYIIDKYYDDSI